MQQMQAQNHMQHMQAGALFWPAQCKAANHCLSVELQAGAADVDEVGAAELEEIGAEDELAEIARVAG